MRDRPSVLHLDLDAFYASVEQRDKPSLRGKPVIVGGTGGRGVVATASYEARRFGVRSAMSTAEARARCPQAAVLAPRFPAYAESSAVVMGLLRELSPLVEPLSLDEAFVDLAADESGTESPTPGRLDVEEVRGIARSLKNAVHERTGLTASVGVASSKLMAKIASDLEKPDGLVVVRPGSERELLDPMPVRTIWGVGPATAERLRRAGIHTVGELAAVEQQELVGLLGQAHGGALWHLARAEDDRPVVPEREAKSVSAEDTFERDLSEPALLQAELDRLAARVVTRMRREGLSGRTVSVKIRRPDFTTLSRSLTLAGPTDDLRTVSRVARGLLAEVDTVGGIRLLGVGVSGLSDWAQADLFDAALGDEATPLDDVEEPDGEDDVPPAVSDHVSDHVSELGGLVVPRPTQYGPLGARGPRAWVPGQDVAHDEHGRGWVWGAGLGRVTIRFEDRTTPPGPVRTLDAEDPALSPAGPLPLEPPGPAASG
ncbi:MAG TPA: DNA polymerase IV [Motilibacteraceae bacterium]|nr:DNA polymerase IV [Motilibacteraceae bacterium]